VDWYDVEWPDGTVEKGIPATLVEALELKEHEHPKKKK